MLKNGSNVLATSARGASFLVLLQIGSRALTFAVNQVLLRYLSPDLLGISSQLELYSISVLYFARESLRVALQRQRPRSQTLQDGVSGKSDTDSHGAQDVVNLSYLAVLLGPLFASSFAVMYLRKIDAAVLSTPYIHTSLLLFALATMVELLAEPCFVVVQLQMLYTLRASAETSATLTRCTLTCAMAIWASTSRQNLGVLPFAVGQSGYAIALVAVYYRSIGKTSYKQGFSIRPRILSAESAEYMFSLFYRPTLTLAINLYAQSGLKHLLTQGDSILIALFTSLSSQGVYALASNYGSLLARMLFQPVEESSRGVFARLLNATSSSASNDEKAEEMQVSKEKAIGEPRSATTTDSAAASDPALSARTYLITLLHLYALLSLAIVAVGPTAAPLLLRYVAGPAWVSAGTVLATYCYYIPLLALNGVLEAFVSAAATPTELRIQSAWMLVFSAGFAASGFVLLKVYDLGAKGLVAANAVNMVMRILWSWSFVTSFLRARRVTLVPTDCLPDPTSTGVGVLVASCLIVLSRSFSGSIMDLVKTGAVGAIYGLVLLYSERLFLYDCYLIVKPVSEPQIMQTANQNKERTLPSL